MHTKPVDPHTSRVCSAQSTEGETEGLRETKEAQMGWGLTGSLSQGWTQTTRTLQAFIPDEPEKFSSNRHLRLLPKSI